MKSQKDLYKIVGGPRSCSHKVSTHYIWDADKWLSSPVFIRKLIATWVFQGEGGGGGPGPQSRCSPNQLPESGTVIQTFLEQVHWPDTIC